MSPAPIEVRKVPLHNVSDASELAKLIDEGVIEADRVIAVIGKTEGNGGVNDYTRIIADRAFREVLEEKGTRSMEEVKQIPIVWSGGTDGVISPHATIFATAPRGQGREDRRAAADGRLRDERASCCPRTSAGLPMVEKVAAGVRKAMEPGRHHRPGRRPLRADQDAAADHRDHQRRQEPRQGRLYRGHPQARWTSPTARRRSASRSRSARSRCRRRSRSARPLAVLRRSRPARRASSWTRRRSSSSATPAGTAAATGSATG